jgi:cellulose synthase (UDP-forming)
VIEVTQLWLSLLVLALGLIAMGCLAPKNVTARRIGAVVVAVLMLRYLHWRMTETMPPLGLDGQSLLAIGFLAIEMLSSMAGLMTLHGLSDYRNRSAEADAHTVESHSGGPPLIDVLIPTYNESAEILRRTIICAVAQDYPRFRVWVCDDLRRPWMRELAEELGANYLTRPTTSMARRAT